MGKHESLDLRTVGNRPQTQSSEIPEGFTPLEYELKDNGETVVTWDDPISDSDTLEKIGQKTLTEARAAVKSDHEEEAARKAILDFFDSQGAKQQEFVGGRGMSKKDREAYDAKYQNIHRQVEFDDLPKTIEELSGEMKTSSQKEQYKSATSMTAADIWQKSEEKIEKKKLDKISKESNTITSGKKITAKSQDVDLVREHRVAETVPEKDQTVNANQPDSKSPLNISIDHGMESKMLTRARQEQDKSVELTLDQMIDHNDAYVRHYENTGKFAGEVMRRKEENEVLRQKKNQEISQENLEQYGDFDQWISQQTNNLSDAQRGRVDRRIEIYASKRTNSEKKELSPEEAKQLKSIVKSQMGTFSSASFAGERAQIEKLQKEIQMESVPEVNRKKITKKENIFQDITRTRKMKKHGFFSKLFGFGK